MGGIDIAITGDTLLAGAAILIAAWSAWTAHRAFKLTKGASQPAVSVEIRPLEDHADWWRIHIVVTNRSDHLLNAESLQIWWPFKAKLLASGDAYEQDHAGGIVIKSTFPTEAMRRRVLLHMSLARYGQQGSSNHRFYGTRDTNSEDVFLFRPRKGKSWVWLRLRLAFSDSTNKRMAISIRRLL